MKIMTMKRSADEAEKKIHQHNLITVHWHIKSIGFFNKALNTGLNDSLYWEKLGAKNKSNSSIMK